MKLLTDTKKMNAIVKAINEKINEKTARQYNGDEAKMRDYGVRIVVDKKNADVEIYPNNGDTLYCIGELVMIAEYFGVSFYVTTNTKGELVFRMCSIFKM